MVPRWVSVCLLSDSVSRMSVRNLFPDDNLSGFQWIFTKISMCIDIVAIRFWIANRKI